MEKRDLTRLLGWPGYRVYKYEVDEAAKTLKLWVRRKPIHRGFECSGCGRRLHAVVAAWEREVADSGLLRVQGYGGGRGPSVELCGVRTEGGEDRASSQQGALYQEVRRPSGAGVRECGGAKSGPAVRVAGEHRPRDRSAVFGTVGSQTAKGSAEATRRGRNLYGREDPVRYGGE